MKKHGENGISLPDFLGGRNFGVAGIVILEKIRTGSPHFFRLGFASIGAERENFFFCEKTRLERPVGGETILFNHMNLFFLMTTYFLLYIGSFINYSNRTNTVISEKISSKCFGKVCRKCMF